MLVSSAFRAISLRTYLTPHLSLQDGHIWASKLCCADSGLAQKILIRNATTNSRDGGDGMSHLWMRNEDVLSPTMDTDMRVGVLIVGSGVTGLTAAYYLQRAAKLGLCPLPPCRVFNSGSQSESSKSATHGAEFTGLQKEVVPDNAEDSCPGNPIQLPWLVIESGDRIGGCLESQKSACGSFVWDSGANSFRLTPELRILIKELSLNEKLQTAPPEAPRFVAVNGTLQCLPQGLLSLLRSQMFSLHAKLRLLRVLLLGARPGFGLEQVIAREESGGRSKPHGSLASEAAASVTVSEYISSVLGDEVLKKAVAALVTGIYAGDTRQLSMKLALPSLKDFLDVGLVGLARAKVRSVLSRIVNFFDLSLGSVQDKTDSNESSAEMLRVFGASSSSLNSSSSGRVEVANLVGGVQTLVQALSASFPSESVQLGTKLLALRVVSLTRSSRESDVTTAPFSNAPEAAGDSKGSFVAWVKTGSQIRRIAASHVLLTVPPSEVAATLGTRIDLAANHGCPWDADVNANPILSWHSARSLEKLPFASIALVTLALRTDAPQCRQRKDPRGPRDREDGFAPPGFGFLVSPEEARLFGWRSLGVLSVSRVFSGRAPTGFQIVTGFVGGALDASAVEEPDERLVQRVLKDISRATGLPQGLRLLPDSDEQYVHSAGRKGLPSKDLEGAAFPIDFSAGGQCSNPPVVFYRVLGVRRWRNAIIQFGPTHEKVLQSVNSELVKQQQKLFPHSRLLVEGGWVSGVAVGDRVAAGMDAARIILTPLGSAAA